MRKSVSAASNSTARRFIADCRMRIADLKKEGTDASGKLFRNPAIRNPQSAIPSSPQARVLPELDEHAVGAARRNERRLPAATDVRPVDDAHAVGFQLSQQRIEVVDVDREVVEALAPL